jgi:UDP-GlcNAc:undecaprenyl-phosphate/decaprenyl-phosphate GlcNAc-1-phosphate transferase
MTTCLAVFVVAFLLAVILTNGVRASAQLLGLVDKPDNYRKLHKRAVPRLGGLSIFFAFFLPLAFLYFFYRNQVSDLLLVRPDQLGGLLAGSTLALLVGLIDDLRTLKAGWKLLFQIIAASVAWATGLSIEAISNPFGGPLVLGLYSFPVTVLWFVICMNAVNLMDGLDGLAAGVCLFVSLTLFLVSLHFRNVLAMVLMSCFSGAVFGFLLFNFYPAKIFLGDSGSMLLGFLVGALSLIGSTRKAETAIALLIPVVALGVPIFDTSLTILRRWYKKFPIGSPDRQHIHHVLLSMGYSQPRAVLTLYVTTIVLGGAALLITIERSEVTILVLGSLALIAFVCVRVLGNVRLEDVVSRLTQAQSRKRTMTNARVSVERAMQQMHSALTAGGLWEACSEAFKDLGLAYATLKLARGAGTDPQMMSWLSSASHPPAGPGKQADTWSGSLSIQRNNRDYGVLEIGMKVSGTMPLAEIPEYTDLLRHEFAKNLDRLAAGPTTLYGEKPLEGRETIDEAVERPWSREP